MKELIERIATANPLWGAPRVHAELLGLTISQRTVSRWMPRREKPPSPTWRSFLNNHVKDLVSVDFVTVPPATFQVLFGFLVLAHDRRRVVHFNVTANPTAQWTAQQVVEAFPWESAPRYLLRDRDSIFGGLFRRRVRGMGIEEVLTAYRSPWQSPFVERLIGSIRRECLDHVIVLREKHLRRILGEYLRYYHRSRTHLSLEKGCPDPRAVQAPGMGEVVEFPEVGALHHRHERLWGHQLAGRRFGKGQDIYSIDVLGARSTRIRATFLDAAGLYGDFDCPRVASLTALADTIARPARLRST